MKITKSQLKRIIKEEIYHVLNERKRTVAASPFSLSYDDQRKKWAKSYRSGVHREVWQEKIKEVLPRGASDAQIKSYYDKNILPRAIDTIMNTPVEADIDKPHPEAAGWYSNEMHWQPDELGQGIYVPREGGHRLGRIYIDPESFRKGWGPFSHELAHSLDRNIPRPRSPETQGPRKTLSALQIKNIQKALPDVGRGPSKKWSYSQKPWEIYTDLLLTRLKLGRKFIAKDIEDMKKPGVGHILGAALRRKANQKLNNQELADILNKIAKIDKSKSDIKGRMA